MKWLVFFCVVSAVLVSYSSRIEELRYRTNSYEEIVDLKEVIPPEEMMVLNKVTSSEETVILKKITSSEKIAPSEEITNLDRATYPEEIEALMKVIYSEKIASIEEEPATYLLIDCGNGNIIYSSIEKEDGILAIDSYFREKNLPLAGYGDVFINVSQKWRLDWRLLPAIAFRESTGGKFLFRPYNPFGWGRRTFSNFTEAINEVGRNLSGNDPDTKGFYYDKTMMQKLRIYNSELYTYPQEIWWIMGDIARQIVQKTN